MTDKLVSEAEVYELEAEIRRRKDKQAADRATQIKDANYTQFTLRPGDTLLGRCYVGTPSSTYNRELLSVTVHTPGDSNGFQMSVRTPASDQGVSSFQKVVADKWNPSPYGIGLKTIIQHITQAYIDAMLADPGPVAYACAKVILEYKGTQYRNDFDPRILEDLFPAAVENLASKYSKQELMHAAKVLKINESMDPQTARTAKQLLKEAQNLSTRADRRPLKELPDEILQRFVATSSPDGWRTLLEPLTEVLALTTSVEAEQSA